MASFRHHPRVSLIEFISPEMGGESIYLQATSISIHRLIRSRCDSIDVSFGSLWRNAIEMNGKQSGFLFSNDLLFDVCFRHACQKKICCTSTRPTPVPAFPWYLFGFGFGPFAAESIFSSSVSSLSSVEFAFKSRRGFISRERRFLPLHVDTNSSRCLLRRNPISQPF